MAIPPSTLKGAWTLSDASETSEKMRYGCAALAAVVKLQRGTETGEAPHREYREFTGGTDLALRVEKDSVRVLADVTCGAPDRMVSLLTSAAFVNVSHPSAGLSSIESKVAARLMSPAGCDDRSRVAEQVSPRRNAPRRELGGVDWVAGHDATKASSCARKLATRWSRAFLGSRLPTGPLLAPAPWPRASPPR